MCMDMEFKKIADWLENVEINTTTARDHVGEIERGIRVVKERGRAIMGVLPFESLHKQIVIHLIYFVVF